MHFCRRLVRSAVVCTLVCSTVLSTACTTMKRIDIAQPRNAAFGPIKSGDRVAVRLSQGREVVFVVGSVEGETLVAEGGERYHRGDIQQIRRETNSVTKTIFLVAGVAAGTLFVVAALAFLSWDGPLSGM